MQVVRYEEELRRLATTLAAAKTAEENVKKHRISLEENIAKFIESPDVGQKTVKLKNGLKITVKRGYNYKADLDAIKDGWDANWSALPIVTKESLDTKGYEYYLGEKGDAAALLRKHVTLTPKKVAVTLKTPE